MKMTSYEMRTQAAFLYVCVVWSGMLISNTKPMWKWQNNNKGEKSNRSLWLSLAKWFARMGVRKKINVVYATSDLWDREQVKTLDERHPRCGSGDHQLCWSSKVGLGLCIVPFASSGMERGSAHQILTVNCSFSFCTGAGILASVLTS